MPHATMKLIPGIDTNKTPALNEAAFSESQLVRFIPDRNGLGLVQKMGGWVNWYGGSTGQSPIFNITDLHAWEDLNNIARLAVGSNNSLSFIGQTSRSQTVITPQTISGDSIVGSSKTVTINIGTSTFTPAVSNTYINGTPVTFTTTGALPTGITVGLVYYVINSTGTTFQIAGSIGGGAVSLSGSQSGTQTVAIPIASTTSGSSTVTIYDVGTGVQAVTFASNIVTVGLQASGANGIVPSATAQVIFTGSSLPSGVSANTTYYVINPTSTTYQISATSGGSAVTFSSGSGTQYSSTPTQMQMKAGYSVNILTPISISNFIISGVYNIVSTIPGSYYNIYTITSAVTATLTTASGSLPSFTTTLNLNTVTVSQQYNSYIGGQGVAYLYPTTVGGTVIYGNYIVQSNPTPTSSSYGIIGSGAASSTATVSMNGGYAHLQYYFNIASLSSAGGYGSGQYGYGGYGQGLPIATSPTNTITSTDWVINNYGEILVANPQGGPIYYWAPSNNTSTAYLLNTAPQVNQGIFIAMPARQIVAYGSTATGIQDPLLVRWSDAGDATTWIASANNQAGSYRIPEGSAIVGGIQGPQQAFLWTDIAVWAMQYVGPQNVYGFNKLGDGFGLIGKKAVGIIGNSVYWMSPEKFCVISGSGPQPVACPVWDKIYQNINTNLYSLIRCGTNSVFGEIIWYYPSSGYLYNNSYVKYNIYTQQWDYGTLERNAWIDETVLGTPIGSSPVNGIIYQHEVGYNADTQPMISSFKTGYMQLNDADNLIFIDQVWPDFKWQTADNSTTSSTLYITFYGTNYPGDTPVAYGPYSMTQSTEYLSVRIRHRLLAIGVSTSPDGTNADLNSFFRIGAVRYRLQPDGKF